MNSRDALRSTSVQRCSVRGGVSSSTTSRRNTSSGDGVLASGVVAALDHQLEYEAFNIGRG